MADQQVGNAHGLPIVGNDNLNENDSKLSDITDSGVNTVTVDNLEGIEVGSLIDIVTKADGTVVASARTVESLTSAGVLTYSGADVASTNNEGVYAAGTYGQEPQEGFFDPDLATVGSLRRRLKQIDAGYYTDAQLDKMSYNDMVYAVRVNDHSGTIKQ